MPLPNLAAQLLQFFLCVCTENGERYPSGSIRNFHRSFGRILLKAQKARIAQTNFNEPIFCIETNPYFVEVNSTVVASMELSRDVGVNKDRKKPKCLSYAKESLILNHDSHKLHHALGVLKRMLWFNTTRFFIRGYAEMYKLQYRDFKLGVNEAGALYVE
jgi:hypothetical protein